MSKSGRHVLERPPEERVIIVAGKHVEDIPSSETKYCTDNMEDIPLLIQNEYDMYMGGRQAIWVFRVSDFEKFIKSNMETLDKYIFTSVVWVKKAQYSDQICMQRAIQECGLNIVTCNNCDTVFIHRCADTEISCPNCSSRGEPCDFADLWV